MEHKLVTDLIKAREALKQKLRTLRADIAQSQREIDIQYAPIAQPLAEIAKKLDVSKLQRGKLHSIDPSKELEESWSDILPEKSYAAIPGTSILRQGTPTQKRHQQRHISWFSPYTHSSPTKQRTRQLEVSPQQETSITATPDIKRKTRMSQSFTQPTFLEDEYIGEFLPDTPKEGESKGSEELDTDESYDLEKSMAHAVSLLKTRPSKSIIANKTLNKTLIETDVVKEALKNHDPTIRPYLMGLMTDENDEFDQKYGVREVKGALKVGNVEITFDGPNIIIGKFTYKATKGLLELLFKKKPGKFLYNDAKNYKFILNDTSAHRVNYDPDNKYAANKAHKYTTIIKPIIQGKKPEVWWTRTWKTGLGLSQKSSPQKILIPKSTVEYKYWDDVNELCDRLKLLVASKDAGHTGHDNEILAIVEELKESKIIK